MSDPRQMRAAPSRLSAIAPDLPGRLVARSVLVWAGLCLCMGLLTATGVWTPMAGGTPASPDAAAHILRLYGEAQSGGLVLLALLAACSPSRTRWLSRLSAPAIAVVVQALWLTPLPSPSSSAPSTEAFPAPSLYVVVEAFKAVWLLAVGFGSGLMPMRVSPARVQHSSWIPISPARPIPDRAWPPFPGA